MTINEKSIEEFVTDREMLHYVESLLSTPIIQDNIREKEIEPVLANRWYGNFYGLLHNELYISPNALYLHLRINGFRLNTDYKGSRKIKVLEPEVFEEILDAYEKNKAYKNSLGN